MMENIPNELLVLGSILIGLSIVLISFFFLSRNGTVVEVILLLFFITIFFIALPFIDAMMQMSYLTISYSIFGWKINGEKRVKQLELKEKLKRASFVEIIQQRQNKRIVVDFGLTLFVSLGAVLFYIFAPETFAVMKFLIVVMMIAIVAQVMERFGNFYSTKVFWLPDRAELVIISCFQSREIPISDLEEIQQESSPDILKLHPMFTLLAENQDYTNSFQPVLKLAFPGENIFISPLDIQRWSDIFSVNVIKDKDVETMQVLPFWHPLVLKRFFWKGYFAITVKGVSAYTGLLLILIWLEVPTLVVICFILFWWMLNLYVSDRVLVAATDAIEMTEGEIFERAQALFKKASIPNARLFLVDSPIHNGLATGMNIGRGTVMLTKATLQLSIEAIEAIIAHEIIHIKKRDVLKNQLARLAFIGLVAGAVYLFYEQIVKHADNLFITLPFFYCLMLVYPIYLSLVAQWAEIRADHLGAELLGSGRNQMEKGLCELEEALDSTLTKAAEYRTVKPERTKEIQIKNIGRNSWLFRFIEFQFLTHPPLYWRIKTMNSPLSLNAARRKWMVGRITESLPDFRRASAK